MRKIHTCTKCHFFSVSSSTKQNQPCIFCEIPYKRNENQFEEEISVIEEESNFEQMLEVDSKITNLFLEIAENYGNDMVQFAIDRVAQINEYKNGDQHD